MAKAKTINLEPLDENMVELELVGDTDLILHPRSRYYLMSEIWKQTHDKGEDMPNIFKQGKNKWEGLITSIHWMQPIEFHDEDISLYTEEEWNDYMKNNQPGILTMAFAKSFKEAFVTFYRDSTGKAGTDFQRALNISETIVPIEFASVRIEEAIVPTKGIGGSTVYCGCNVFSGWKTKIVVSCPKIVFPLNTIIQIIATSGKYIGIGTQRANGYGRYHIESATVINQ